MAAAGMGHSFNPTRGRYKTDGDGVACVKLLEAAGGKLNETDLEGLTALHAAAQHGWDDTVKLLVTDGADLQPKDKLGLTPYDHAAGKQPRAFLEPEHVPHQETMALLKGYIVAATGKPPIEFAGSMNRQTRGTGGAVGGGLQPAGTQVAQGGGTQGGGTQGAAAGAGAGSGSQDHPAHPTTQDEAKTPAQPPVRARAQGTASGEDNSARSSAETTPPQTAKAPH